MPLNVAADQTASPETSSSPCTPEQECDAGEAWAHLFNELLAHIGRSSDPATDLGILPTKSDTGGDLPPSGAAFDSSDEWDEWDQWLNEPSAPAYSNTSSSASFGVAEPGDGRTVDMPHVHPAIHSPRPCTGEAVGGEQKTNALSEAWWATDSQPSAAPLSDG